MNGYCRALAAAVAATCLGGAAAQAEGTTYYYEDGTATGAYSDTFIPGTGYYYQSQPTFVAPAPQIYYAPAYTVRSNTTYYYNGSNHDHYSLSSPAHTTYYAPRVVYPPRPATRYYYTQPAYVAPAQPYGYVPPGLSITTPAGTYAPFYGGWNSYSSPANAGGYNAYRDTAY
jgi:hypothetical protein